MHYIGSCIGRAAYLLSLIHISSVSSGRRRSGIPSSTRGLTVAVMAAGCSWISLSMKWEMCIRDSIKSTDLDMQQDSIQSQLDIYKKQKSQYEKLVKSIQDDKNYFSETDIDDQPYYYQYETYKSQVAQKAFDASPYQAAGYSDEQIKALMEQNQSEVEALYYSTLQSISASLTSVQSNIDNLQSQMDALSTGANDYYIYAPTSGVIHMDTPYKVGMVLSAGTPLATVASENSDLEVVAFVTLNDRPLPHVGDPCKIAITGLSEYSDVYKRQVLHRSSPTRVWPTL